MASTSESTQLSNIEMEAAIEQFSTFTGISFEFIIIYEIIYNNL
jgi:hypothetical protein